MTPFPSKGMELETVEVEVLGEGGSQAVPVWGCPAAQGSDGTRVPGERFSRSVAGRRCEGAGREPAPLGMTAAKGEGWLRGQQRVSQPFPLQMQWRGREPLHQRSNVCWGRAGGTGAQGRAGRGSERATPPPPCLLTLWGNRFGGSD